MAMIATTGIGEELRACDMETRADYFRQSEMTVFGKVPPISAARTASNPNSPWRKGPNCDTRRAQASFMNYVKRGQK